MNAVFDLAKSFSRLQLTDEDMALFSAAVLLSPGETHPSAPCPRLVRASELAQHPNRVTHPVHAVKHSPSAGRN